MDFPIGRILIASLDHYLVRIIFTDDENVSLFSRLRKYYPVEMIVENREKNQTILKQLTEYFEGGRPVFSIPFRLQGTDFQKAVWHAVDKVPYGQTCSYGEIAKQIGKPKATRAVGYANKVNPIPIVIPCHRVIGANGSMVGFASGISLKEKLLDLERHFRFS